MIRHLLEGNVFLDPALTRGNMVNFKITNLTKEPTGNVVITAEKY